MSKKGLRHFKKRSLLNNFTNYDRLPREMHPRLSDGQFLKSNFTTTTLPDSDSRSFVPFASSTNNNSCIKREVPVRNLSFSFRQRSKEWAYELIAVTLQILSSRNPNRRLCGEILTAAGHRTSLVPLQQLTLSRRLCCQPKRRDIRLHGRLPCAEEEKIMTR